MNTLYPDATPEELSAADNVCIICREEMVTGNLKYTKSNLSKSNKTHLLSTASKKLPCNHIFHTSCLRSWFQRQQTCPTCRLNILQTPPGTQQQQAANNNAAAPPAQPGGAAAGAVPQPGMPPNPFMMMGNNMWPPFQVPPGAPQQQGPAAAGKFSNYQLLSDSK